MLARLDRPLRPTGAVKTAGAYLGGDYVAIALEIEPWNRRVHEVDGQAAGMADPARGGRFDRECDHPQDLRCLIEFMARAAMVAVQHRIPAVLAVDPARQRAYPDRHREQLAAEAAARLDRYRRSRLLSDPAV